MKNQIITVEGGITFTVERITCASCNSASVRTISLSDEVCKRNNIDGHFQTFMCDKCGTTFKDTQYPFLYMDCKKGEWVGIYSDDECMLGEAIKQLDYGLNTNQLIH